jgi:hypothetical protein
MADISFERQLRPGNLCLDVCVLQRQWAVSVTVSFVVDALMRLLDFFVLVKYRTTARHSLILRKNVSSVRTWLVSDSGVRKPLPT